MTYKREITIDEHRNVFNIRRVLLCDNNAYLDLLLKFSKINHSLHSLVPSIVTMHYTFRKRSGITMQGDTPTEVKRCR